MPSEPRVAGVILAGGLSRRMGGGDKALRPIGGRTILARVIARAAPQVEAVVLNANGDAARFADTGLPVVSSNQVVMWTALRKLGIADKPEGYGRLWDCG